MSGLNSSPSPARLIVDQPGEIYRLRFPGRSVVVVSTHALVDETCDETRFKKSVNSALLVREMADSRTLFPSATDLSGSIFAMACMMDCLP